MSKESIIKKVIEKLALSPEVDYSTEIPEIPKNLLKVTSPKDAEYMKYIKRIIKVLGLDPMTGVYNKQHFDKLEKEPGIFLYLDGDGIKNINTKFGHDAGHAAILALSAGIKKSLRGKDDAKVSRFGGDEFTIHIKDISIATGVNIGKRIIENINKQKISEFYSGDEKIKKELDEIKLGASIGVGKTEDEADKALSSAKNKGRNRVDFYNKGSSHLSLDDRIAVSEEWFLQGSASSLEALKELMKKKMYWETVIFTPIDSKTWSVASGKGVQSGMRVVYSKGRYRLEFKKG